jgi:predicted DNA-binding WGR domain protein
MNFKFIGWFQEGTSDKVWGVMVLQRGTNHHTFGGATGPGKYVTFWGRRGKKLQTKIFEDYEWNVDRLIESKVDKGYNRVNKNKLDEVYPEFETDLEKTAVWAILRA